MPHVIAAHEAAGFFGVGYAQAEDRLEEILKVQLMVEGRLSSVFGREHLASDIPARKWRHMEESVAAFERLPEQLRADYRAYAAGVRRFMADQTERVPDWAPQ